MRNFQKILGVWNNAPYPGEMSWKMRNFGGVDFFLFGYCTVRKKQTNRA